MAIVVMIIYKIFNFYVVTVMQLLIIGEIKNENKSECGGTVYTVSLSLTAERLVGSSPTTRTKS